MSVMAVQRARMTPRASESGHWYDHDGTPVYEVMGANGKMVAPDIRHARKHGLYPGVTTIIRCAAAPGLETWKQRQVLLAALTLPRRPDESDEDFCARILSDSQEEGRKARERGTQIHAAIQEHYEGRPPTEEMWPYVRGVVDTLNANCGNHSWIAEKPCAHPIGFGTKADLHVPDNIVLDFKGSDFTESEAPRLKTWDEHAMQLAATRNALGYPSADCAIVYVSRNVPGLCRLIWIDEEELKRGWLMFCGLHAYWSAKHRYWPAAWKPERAAA